ncbi:MAG: hypothetical protein AB8U44_02970 [Aaplasma endosymbiont of Hyalomma asiaticum]
MSREGGGGASVFNDPEYREKYREKFLEAQKRGMDMVVYPDGAIALIENRMVMHTYGWHKRRRGFERTKSALHNRRRDEYVGSSGENSERLSKSVPADETEYA